MSHVGHYHLDDNLVPSPRCDFSFEAAFQLWDLKWTISVYIRNASGKIFIVEFQGLGSVKRKIFSLELKELTPLYDLESKFWVFSPFFG